MKAFVIKIWPSLLIIIALMTSTVVAKRLDIETNGNRARTLDTEGKTKEKCNQDATGIPRIVQYVYNNPNLGCYTHFFVAGQPPVGLRAPGNGNIRYICQPPKLPQPQAQATATYATMFDEHLGIAVFAAYTLTPATVNFADRHPHPWCITPGIQRQGSDAIYRAGWHCQKGHLVPSRTYSSSQERLDSTYTYTNAVPQKPLFNQGMWSTFENWIREYARQTCTQPTPGPNGEPAGTLYLLTGTSFVRIQQQNNHGVVGVVGVMDNSHQIGNNNAGEIFVPNSLWTAGCCVRQNGASTRSFAVMGNNVQNNNQNLQLTLQITVQQLQGILAVDVNNIGPNISLFPGDQNCLNNDLGYDLP